MFSLSNRDDHVANIHGANQVWADVLNASTLRKDDFESIATEMKKIQELNLFAVNDLISRGLTFSEDIRTTVVTVESTSDMKDAKVEINPSQFQADDSLLLRQSVPLPIIHGTFQIPWRQEGFDYKQAIGRERKIRKVMEASEDMVVNGNASIRLNVNGAVQQVYGYTNHPDRATQTISDWANVATTAATILANARSMRDKMFNTNKIFALPGSMVLYVPTDAWVRLSEEAFANKGDNSIMQQIIKESNGSISEVKPLPNLATTNVVLVHMDAMNVQLAVAQTPIVVPHVKSVNLQPSTFTAYAAWTPFIHSDFNSLTGIVHGSV